jgi:hypothetical protein
MKINDIKNMLSATVPSLFIVVLWLLPDALNKPSWNQTSGDPLLLPSITPTQTFSGDPALRNPFFAALAKQYGSTWEKDLHPGLVLWVEWQRIIGTHAIITGYGGIDSEGMLPHPGVSEIIIAVTEWDGTDLFSAGLPIEYKGIPIKIIEMGFATTLGFHPPLARTCASENGLILLRVPTLLPICNLNS